VHLHLARGGHGDGRIERAGNHPVRAERRGQGLFVADAVLEGDERGEGILQRDQFLDDRRCVVGLEGQAGEVEAMRPGQRVCGRSGDLRPRGLPRAVGRDERQSAGCHRVAQRGPPDQRDVMPGQRQTRADQRTDRASADDEYAQPHPSSTPYASASTCSVWMTSSPLLRAMFQRQVSLSQMAWLTPEARSLSKSGWPTRCAMSYFSCL